MAYVERGTGTARDARHLVRRLQAVRDGLSAADADLCTFLLVEALDAVKGPAAAMGTLQEHWERRGGTPLATVAVTRSTWSGFQAEARSSTESSLRGAGAATVEAVIRKKAAARRRLTRVPRGGGAGYHWLSAGQQRVGWDGPAAGLVQTR